MAENMQAEAKTAQASANVGRSEKDASAQRPASAQQRPNRRPPAPQDDERWMEDWQRNEIRWLTSEVEELKRRLWWRTVILGGAIALSVLVASALGLIALQDPEQPLVAQAENPPRAPSAPAPSAIAQPDRPSENAGQPSAGASPEAQSAADPKMAQRRVEEAAQVINTAGGADAEALQAAVTATEDYIKQLEAIAERHVGQHEPGAAPAEAQGPDGAGGRGSVDPGELLAALTAEARAAGSERGVGAAAGRAAGTPVAARPPAATGTSPGGAARDEPPANLASALYTATIPVNLRAEPRSDAEVLAILAEGDMVRGIDRQGSWLRVRFIRSQAADLTGYVYSRYLRPVAAPS